MFHYRIVIGICDSVLSKRLQLEAELSFNKAKTLVKQRDAVQEHQVILKNGDFQISEMPVDYVCSRKASTTEITITTVSSQIS